jgi:hypothetical protein
MQRSPYVGAPHLALFVFEVAANQVNGLRLYHGRQDWQREMEAWSQERDAATEEDDTE